jgi:mRNA interferase MazF
MSTGLAPARGEVWLTALGQTRGREQAGTRPALIVSVGGFNQSGAELVVVVPITSRLKRIRSHVDILPPEGGLSVPSQIKCEDVRSISDQRLIRLMGTVSPATMSAVEQRLRDILGL